MQHFQPILIAIGILAIAGVLIHGFLLNRKNKLAERAKQQAELEQIEEQQQQTQRDFEHVAFSDQQDSVSQEQKEPTLNIQALDEAVEVAEQHPTQRDDQIETDDSTENNQLLTEHADDDHQCDAKENSSEQPQQDVQEPEPQQTSQATKEQEPQDLFIFNVVAKDEAMLGGHKLLQFFLTSGFRFGEMNIFHRHENSDGTGEIQFSIANMMAPGTFELDEMEQFTTKGISFFLTAPNPKISVKQSFDLMLRAVVQLADEFDCDVLNAQRDPLTEEQFIEYRNRLQQYP